MKFKQLTPKKIKLACAHIHTLPPHNHTHIVLFWITFYFILEVFPLPMCHRSMYMQHITVLSAMLLFACCMPHNYTCVLFAFSVLINLLLKKLNFCAIFHIWSGLLSPLFFMMLRHAYYSLRSNTKQIKCQVVHYH